MPVTLPTLGLFLLSLIFFVICIWQIVKLIRQKRFSARRISVYVILLVFFISIYLLRLAVEFHLRRAGVENYGGLNSFELLLDSAVHALQTFSMDEDYTLYLAGLRALCTELGGGAVLAALMCGFSAVQNVVAPVIGGAILLDLLSNLFPRLSMLRQCLRSKYVFSELNEKALSLAESILTNPEHLTKLNGKTDNAARPWYVRNNRKCLIFTDAYVAPGDEAASELLYRAKSLGAVCLSDDLASLKMYGIGDVTYLLMDKDETANLNTAIALAEQKHDGNGEICSRYRQLCGASTAVQILFFSQNDSSAELVTKVYDQTEGNMPVDSLLTVKVVREDTAQVYALLDQYPLYLPLLTLRQENHPVDSLSILIIGNDPISREMLLAAYWCGQMLEPNSNTPIQLHLHHAIPCQNGQGAERFRQSLAQDVPGIRLDDTDPYASFSFYDLDSQGDNKADLFIQNPELSACTYFFVSVGDRLVNLKLAHWLQRYYATRNLGRKNPVRILYQVEDNQLCDALNATREDSCIAVGKWADRYSVQNVFTPEIEDRAVHGSNMKQKQNERFWRNEYDRRSKLADAIHAKYKLFSLAPRFLDQMEREPDSVKEEDLSQGIAKALVSADCCGVDGRDRLAWLEHRRWNAYTYS